MEDYSGTLLLGSPAGAHWAHEEADDETANVSNSEKRKMHFHIV